MAGAAGRHGLPDGRWDIRFTPQAEQWFQGLGRREADSVAAVLNHIERGGPALRRPLVGSIKGSRHHEMKELRSVGGHLRALLAFDRKRRAVVLVGGDKTKDWQGWYRHNVRVADELYDKHLRGAGRTTPWRTIGRAGGSSAGRDR